MSAQRGPCMYKDNARKLKLKPEWRSEPAFLKIRLAIRSGFGNDSYKRGVRDRFNLYLHKFEHVRTLVN